MPDPWTTSASASLASGDGIVTLVEGSAFCISSRSGEIDPAHPQGLFFRDTRFVSEMRLLLNGVTPEPLAATAPDPFSGVFVLRGHPSKGHADSHLVVFRRRYVGRGMREDIEIENFGEEAAFCSVELVVDADFADLFEVKEGRVHKQGELSVDVQDARLTFSYKRHSFERDAHRVQRTAAHQRVARDVRDRRAAARALVGVHRGDAGDRRPGGDAALPVRPARRAFDARGAWKSGRSGCQSCPPITTSSASCSNARPRTSPACGSSIPSSPIGPSWPPARRGS